MILNKDNRFDLGVEFGDIYEEELAKQLMGHIPVEVKADKGWRKSGNVYVEYESRGKPSGVKTTKAKYYCFTLAEVDGSSSEMSFLIRTDKLIKYLSDGVNAGTLEKDIPGGDDNTSRGILLPISHIPFISLNGMRK